MDLPDGGFVRYVDHMGSDLTVVNAARVSLGKEHHEFNEKADTQLIRYLVMHRHVSPFYHPQLTVHVKCPIFVERQWFKHRIGTAANSISGRYVQFEPTFWTPEKFRQGADDVKQGSTGEKVERHEYAHWIYDDVIIRAYSAYKELLELGVCREQARAVLPVALMTEFHFTASLLAWWHFYELRAEEHAQEEIQIYARAIGIILQAHFPVCWQAFEENANE